MTPDGALLNHDDKPRNDDNRPMFLNGDYNAADDMGDWWLDLGHIDLPA